MPETDEFIPIRRRRRRTRLDPWERRIRRLEEEEGELPRTPLPPMFLTADEMRDMLREEEGLPWVQLTARKPPAPGARPKQVFLPGSATVGTAGVSEDVYGYQPPEVAWGVGGYSAPGPNVPSWWLPFAPTDRSQANRPDVALSLMMNTLIPYLSPEDQVRTAHHLYQMWDTDLSAYKPDRVRDEPGGLFLPEELARGVRGRAVANPQYFLSAERARDAIQALSNMREEMVQGNRWELGPGYKWLQNVLGAIETQGGGRTRANYLAMLGALDPLLSQAQSGELAAFGGLGEMLARPFFSRGQLRRVSRSGNQYLFGAANPYLMY